MICEIASITDEIVRESTRRGFDVLAHGMTIEQTADKDGIGHARIHMPHPYGGEKKARFTDFELTSVGVKAAKSAVRSWITDIIPDSNSLAARNFFSGQPGIPYMGDAVVGRMLEHVGSSWEDLVERIRKVTSMRTSADMDKYPICTYSGIRPPKVFEQRYYKQAYGLASHGLPEMQMRLATRGRHLTLDVEIGEGCMWNAWGSGQVWLSKKYPDSICMAMIGRPVVDVVAHPAFDIPDFTVKKMRYDGRRTVLEVTQIVEEIPGRVRRALDKAA